MPDSMIENDILEQEKKSVEDIISIKAITADNAVFERTGGGFVRMTFAGKDYSRIAVHRCFPHSDPTAYISIREPEGDSKEIGLIENLADLPAGTREMLEEQMALRYFAPKIQKIHAIKEEYGYSYWDVTTDKGRCRFTVRMGGGSVYTIGSNRYLVNDLDGNRFEIPDLYALSAKEIKKLDLPNDNKEAVYERMISERNNIAATYTAEGDSEAKVIRNTTDKEVAIQISDAEKQGEILKAEGEAEYMRILAEAYSDEEKTDFYSYVRSLDALKESMSGENKTVVLPADSPIAQIFGG